MEITIELADTDRLETVADLPGFNSAIFRGVKFNDDGTINDVFEVKGLSRFRYHARKRGYKASIASFRLAYAKWVARLIEDEPGTVKTPNGGVVVKVDGQQFIINND